MCRKSVDLLRSPFVPYYGSRWVYKFFDRNKGRLSVNNRWNILKGQSWR